MTTTDTGTTPTTASGITAGTDRRVTNDLDLVRDVLRLACTPGYVLLGPAERVHRCQPTSSDGRAARLVVVVAVPGYEADAVGQLLDTGHLRRGGRHTVHHADQAGPATGVLVPRSSRAMLARWDSLVPPGGRGRR